MVLHHQSLQRQILGYHGRIHGRMTSREGALLKGWHNKTCLWSTVSTIFAKCRSNAVSVCQSNVAACSSCYFCNFYTHEPQMANNVKVLSWNPIYDGNQTFQKWKLKAQKRCSKTGSKHCAAAEKISRSRNETSHQEPPIPCVDKLRLDEWQDMWDFCGANR